MNENILDWLETDDFDTYDEGLDSEYGESLFDGEDYDTEFYGESDDAESRASRRRARAIQAAQARRRRQAMMARRKANMRGRGAPRSRGAPNSRRPSASTPEGREIQRTQEGIERTQEGIEKAQQVIEKVELENQVQSDVFGRALVKQQSRITRDEHAIAANIVRGEIERHFPNLVDDPLLKSAIALAPNLMLGLGKGTKGIEGVLSHPAVWSAIAVIGLGVVARTQKQTLTIRIFPTEPPELSRVGSPPDSVQLTAVVQDKNGVPVIPQPAVTWSPTTPDIVDVNSSGLVTAKNAGPGGTAVITASAPGATTGVTTVRVE